MKKFFLLTFSLFLFFNCRSDNYSYLKKIKQLYSSVNLWSEGIIPYTFKGDISYIQKLKIKLAMREWEKSGVIKFKQVDDNLENYNVYIIKKNKEIIYEMEGCYDNIRMCSAWSTVGYQKNSLNMMEITGCINYDMILHELGHCLGLQHEHQRPDRNRYVKINFSNISPPHKRNFNRLMSEDFIYPYKDFDYDYKSIMHYSEYTFSNNCKPTIVAKEPIKRDGLTKSDILKIRWAYSK